jgi:hypothetical protein
MPRKAKPPESFSTAKWAPLIEAVALAEGALGSSYLAEGNLIEHLRSGRLPTARYRGGLLKRLQPTFWKSLRIVQTVHPSGVLVILVLGLADESSAPHLFVARAPLNKLYSTDPTPSGALAEPPGSGPGRPTRRKPGPQPIKDWPTVVARELIRRAYAGEKKPGPAAMVKFCQNTIGHSPDSSDMQKLLKKLL